MAFDSPPASPGRKGDPTSLAALLHSPEILVQAARGAADKLGHGWTSQVRSRIPTGAAWRARRWRWPALFVPPAAGRQSAAALISRAALVDWALLTLAVLLYCSRFLDLATRRPLIGNEAEVFQALDYTLVNSLQAYGRFPLWNPYIASGLPFVSDPFLHVFDPLATIPVLLFGVAAGFKIALFLSFLAAALGTWLLGRVLGLSRPLGLWLALMYAFSGQAVAKFVQGQYDFVLGFAWIPWVVAFLLLAVRTRRRAHTALAALSVALLFFAGNLYYSYYLLYVVALFAATAVLTIRPARPFVALQWDRLGVLAVVGVLALGLVAVQLLPVAEFLPHFGKATDPQLTESHTLQQIWRDFTSPELPRPDAMLYTPLQPEEYYAYISLLPFVALLLLPLAVTRQSRRTILFFVLLVAFAVLWIDLRDTPLRELYAQSTMLQQFRYPTRFLIYGGFAILVLAALGLDALWRRCEAGLAIWRGAGRGAGRRSWRAFASIVALGLLSGGLLWSLLDVSNENRAVMATRDQDEAPRAVASLLAGEDRSNYYVSAPNYWHAAVLSSGLRFFDAWYGISDIRSPTGQLNIRTIQARPRYAIRPNDATPPDAPAAEVFRRLDQYTVYRLPSSLPFAFTAPNQTITDLNAAELVSADVAAIPALIASTDAIEVIADGQANTSLVVLVTAYPGWQAWIDGRPAPLINVGGYLATALQPGVHRYSFAFDLASFKVGLLLSLAALLAVLVLLWSDARVLWRSAAPWPAPRPGFAGPRGGWREWAALGRGGVATAQGWLIRDQAWTRPRWAVLSLGGALFLLALGIYAVTRFVALDQFPIYFFADEAIEPVLARDLLQHGLHDARGNFLPVFFNAYGYANPLISVYAHALSISLFGMSVEVTRATSAFVTMLGAVGVALALRTVFQVRCWWAAVFILATIPAWFLHTRTGFEAVVMASFYAWFVLCYLLYRCRSPRFLYPALIFAALTFYSYGNGQMVIGATAVFLFFADLGYHLRNWRTLLPGFVLLVVLAVPFFQWRTQTPQAIDAQLTRVGSYLVQDRPVQDKLLQFTRQYADGLSPGYWFVPNERDLARHRVDGLGNMPGLLLPLFLLGGGLCLWRVRSAPYRTVLLAALATPVGGAISEIGLLRVIAFVVPATMFSVLGLDLLLARLRAPRAWAVAACTVAALFVVGALWLLQLALSAGPYWYRDYGLYGMQWGASQVFEQVREDLQANPADRYYVTSTWANGADVFVRFFVPGETRVQVGHVNQLAYGQQPLDDHMVFVMTSPEYAAVQASAKFKSIQVDRVLPYPDGSPGFYWARLAYADNADELFAAEREARRQLVTASVPWQGEILTVSHSQVSAGEASYLFDGKSGTLVRGLEANPFILEIAFPSPRPLAGMSVQLGSMNADLRVALTGTADDEIARYETSELGTRQDPVVDIPFDRGPPLVTKVRLETKDLRQGDNAQIHIREVTFR